MIDRLAKEPLNLTRVKIHRNHTIDSACLEKVGDQFGGDRRARRRLSILSRISIIGNHRRNTLRRGSPHGVYHDQELHQIVIDWRRKALDDENVAMTNAGLNLDPNFPIGEPIDLRLSQPQLQVRHNTRTQRRI